MAGDSPNPAELAGIGLELAGAVGAMALLGYLVDRWLGTGPWGVVVGAMLGVAGGLYNLIKRALKENR